MANLTCDVCKEPAQYFPQVSAVEEGGTPNVRLVTMNRQLCEKHYHEEQKEPQCQAKKADS